LAFRRRFGADWRMGEGNLESVLKKHAELNVFADSFNLGHLTKTSPEDLEAALRRLPYANAAELSEIREKVGSLAKQSSVSTSLEKAQAARLWGLYWGLHSGGKQFLRGNKGAGSPVIVLGPGAAALAREKLKPETPFAGFERRPFAALRKRPPNAADRFPIF